MALKDLQSSREQVFELRIGGRWNQRGLERAIDCLVIRHLVVNVRFIKGSTIELRSSQGEQPPVRFGAVEGQRECSPH